MTSVKGLIPTKVSAPSHVSRPPDKLEKFSPWTQLSPERIPGSDSYSQHELPREGLLSWGLPLEQSES